MNAFLNDFLRKCEEREMKPDPPNKVKEKKGTPVITYEGGGLNEIIEKKPHSKRVMEILKERINEIIQND